jgi:hypothetical protein
MCWPHPGPALVHRPQAPQILFLMVTDFRSSNGRHGLEIITLNLSCLEIAPHSPSKACIRIWIDFWGMSGGDTECAKSSPGPRRAGNEGDGGRCRFWPPCWEAVKERMRIRWNEKVTAHPCIPTHSLARTAKWATCGRGVLAPPSEDTHPYPGFSRGE